MLTLLISQFPNIKAWKIAGTLALQKILMKGPFLYLAFFLRVVCCSSQSLLGITEIPDTSFTNYSALQNILKTHPDIKLIPTGLYKEVASQKGIVFTTRQKRPLRLDVFFPKKPKINKRIAIMIIHGGGWRSGNRAQHYPLAEKLASLGYTCFTPEYRLSTEALFPAAVNDLKSAIRWIREHASQYTIDTSKIVALGFSAGGELAAFLGTTGNLAQFDAVGDKFSLSSRPDAVIDIDGILSFIHPESGEGDDSKKVSAATYWLGYPKKGNEKSWEAASPLTYANNSTPPTLFINSSVDRMHAGRNDYIKILDGFSIYTEVHSFENAPHTFCLFDPWFEPTVSYIDNFLQNIFRK